VVHDVLFSRETETDTNADSVFSGTHDSVNTTP
jgi:hypothetical protein